MKPLALLVVFSLVLSSCSHAPKTAPEAAREPANSNERLARLECGEQFANRIANNTKLLSDVKRLLSQGYIHANGACISKNCTPVPYDEIKYPEWTSSLSATGAGLAVGGVILLSVADTLG